jgi:chemotaxis protein histidine kinase CheA
MEEEKKFQAEYLKTVPEKMQDLKELIQKLEQNIGLETLNSFRLKVHKIAGSAGTFGFMNASILSKAFEQEILANIALFNSQKKVQECFLKNCQLYLEKLQNSFI